MERIVRERIYPQAARPLPRLKLSPLLLILSITVVGFAVAIVGVRAAARYGRAPANPFPAYADVYPDEPMSAVEVRAFSCQTNANFYYAPTEESCTFAPPEGVFSSIEVLASKGIIVQLTFNMRDNTLNVGDLAGLLEMPTIHRFNRTAFFLLPTSLVRVDTLSHREQFSLFRPVWSITFMKLS